MKKQLLGIALLATSFAAAQEKCKARFDVPMAESVTTRYVKIDMTEPSLPSYGDNNLFYQIAEVEVLSDGENIAIGCPVTSIEAWNLAPSWQPSNITDGLIMDNSLLGYTSHPLQDMADKHADLVIDLGAECQVDGVIIYPRQDAIANDLRHVCNFPITFTVEVSSDAERYDVIYEANQIEAPYYNISGHEQNFSSWRAINSSEDLAEGMRIKMKEYDGSRFLGATKGFPVASGNFVTGSTEAETPYVTITDYSPEDGSMSLLNASAGLYWGHGTWNAMILWNEEPDRWRLDIEDGVARACNINYGYVWFLDNGRESGIGATASYEAASTLRVLGAFDGDDIATAAPGTQLTCYMSLSCTGVYELITLPYDVPNLPSGSSFYEVTGQNANQLIVKGVQNMEAGKQYVVCYDGPHTPYISSVALDCRTSTTTASYRHELLPWETTLEIQNPSEIALFQLIPQLQQYEEENVVVSAEGYALYESIMERWHNNIGGTEEALSELAAEAEALVVRLGREAKAYAALEALCRRAASDNEVIGTYGALGDWVCDQVDFMSDHYENRDITADEIEELVANYERTIEDGLREYIATEAKPGTDISLLIKNRDMDEGEEWSNQWNHAPIPGWDEASTAPWCYHHSAGEYWNMNFNLYQDIERLPIGKYTISFQGLYRKGNEYDALNAYTIGEEDENNVTAYVYGNNVETPINSWFCGLHPLRDGEAESGDPIFPTGLQDEAGNDLYLPLSLAAFAQHIKADPQSYLCETTALVGSDGHLRIGIKLDNCVSGSWVTFDSFRLRYEGSDANSYEETIRLQLEQLFLKRDLVFQTNPLPADVYNSPERLEARVEAALAGTSDDCVSLLSDIANASAEIDRVLAIIKEYIGEIAYYELHVWDENCSDDFALYFEEVYPLVTEDVYGTTPWATTDELVAAISKLTELYTADVFASAGEATADTPVEVSGVIRNRDFWDEYENVSSAIYWSGAEVGGCPHSLLEFWNSNYNVLQTIPYLPAGSYRLTVQGFYRQGMPAQEHADCIEAGKENIPATLYAVTDDATVESAIQSIFAGATNEDIRANQGIGYVDVVTLPTEDGSRMVYVPASTSCAREYFDYVTEESEGFYNGNQIDFLLKEDNASVTIGVRNDNFYPYDWTVLDRFQLWYYGATAPNAIEHTTAGHGTVTGKAYYTAGGVRLTRAQKGLNIVVNTLSDGTRTTTKQIVK